MNTTLAHLARELERLDLLLHREILRLRTRYQLSLDEFRGLYVSDEQVDALLQSKSATDSGDIDQQVAHLYARNQEGLDPACAWNLLASEFDLSLFDQDALLLALAPELDLKYETLYGYLNNDVSRKWPTRDLALRLFSSNSDRLAHWDRLTPTAPLFRSELVVPIPSSNDRTSTLAGGFCPSAVLVQHLFCDTATASLKRLEPATDWQALQTSDAIRSDLQTLGLTLRNSISRPIIVLEGGPGSGKQLAARLLATEIGYPLLCLDAAAAVPPDILQLRLAGAALLITNGAAFFDREARPTPEAIRFLSALEPVAAPVFLACDARTPWRDLLGSHRHLAFTLEPPAPHVRRELWHHELALQQLSADDYTLDSLAQRFRFTPGQIADTVQNAFDLPRQSTRESLFAAARKQSGQRLGKLAVKLSCDQDWADLVLPPATLRTVRETATAIENRNKVMVEWGMRPGPAASSLNILFSGASGTGKTMTAGIIARHLGVDIYRIDLSGIVSKYIGETEKNLDRIFDAAHESNAILFFDEADALFGRRSEVKDAHDRYANIEVSYLLQKLESPENDCVVILATNLSSNIDAAFTRRIQYVVEFPAPGEAYREMLWHSMFPARAPLAPGIDFPFLARQFQLTGGEIRNVSIDAAFLAAADGQRITMPLLLKAVSRHLVKSGRIPSAIEFKQYFPLLTEPAMARSN
jgi:AAA+ superfamily predicted ATPase